MERLLLCYQIINQSFFGHIIAIFSFYFADSGKILNDLAGGLIEEQGRSLVLVLVASACRQGWQGGFKAKVILIWSLMELRLCDKIFWRSNKKHCLEMLRVVVRSRFSIFFLLLSPLKSYRLKIVGLVWRTFPFSLGEAQWCHQSQWFVFLDAFDTPLCPPPFPCKRQSNGGD